MNSRMIPELYDRHMDRLLGRQEDQDEGLDAAREQGAEIAAREILGAAKRANKFAEDDRDGRVRLFIAHFCGGIEPFFPDLAREIAKGAGMDHLYPEGE